jgi:hypothetical protein
MTPRTIVTSQPDVACDVCERRLLRGEQPDVFLAAGRRRTVCELCAPRAAHEGWLRERDSESVTMPPMRPRRGRSLFDRLRQVGRPAGGVADAPAGSRAEEREPEPYDFLDGYTRAGADPVPAVAHGRSAPSPAALADEADEGHGPSTLRVTALEAPAAAHEPGSYVEQAIEVFNAGEYPRRVAGIARSLGAPVVSVRPAEHLDSVVVIVVAWELCWYRYEVDLSEGIAETRVLAQGTELGELAREELVANAVVGEYGALSLLAP